MGAKSFSRTVGLIVAAIAGGAAVLLWFAIASTGPLDGPTSSIRGIRGVWGLFFDLQAPTARVLAAAVALAILFAAGIALLEQRTKSTSHRSTNRVNTPLAPKLVMAASRGVFAGPLTVTVLIPAHNEEASLPETLSSLFAQSHQPERVIVVADNCTDSTVAIARTREVEVFESVDNTDKKAGALNQALKTLLPFQGDNDVIMVLDADTTLDDGFLAAAVDRLTDDRALMSIGGLFYGEEGFGLLGQFQRNEYVRYSRQIRRRRGHVFVLTGTASLFRSAALRAVADNRSVTIPGKRGDVYDTAALTEDNELTLALRSLGALIISPAQCTVVTELMPTLRTLWTQRLRWQRGALENIGAYGVTPPTFRYWVQQLGIGYSVIALSSFMFLLLLTALSVDRMVWFPFWLGLGSVFIAERVVSVWRAGWRGRLLAGTLFPELFYDVFLDAVYVKGILDITFGREASWGHGKRVIPTTPTTAS
ncbi:MAG: glycosyltransferase family 2 protein [Ramlibacter sp.]|nr:glycosyltransferase family 2 protein [Cryobacterium sp.]